MPRKTKPWGGRFASGTDAFVEEFTASIPYDLLLYRHDIEGSIAHARMLGKQGIIPRGWGRSGGSSTPGGAGTIRSRWTCASTCGTRPTTSSG
jgi:hypothetical protein